MTVDPFMNASPIYQQAIRHQHKSGSAFEGYSPRGLSHFWAPLAVLVVLGMFVAVLFTVSA